MFTAIIFIGTEAWCDVNANFKAFMSMMRPPARLTGEQVAWRFGWNREGVRIVSSPETINRIREALEPKERNLVLSGATRLRPLGNPAPMATKYFWEVEISQLEGDVVWLDKAARTIREYWRLKKRGKDNSASDDEI